MSKVKAGWLVRFNFTDLEMLPPVLPKFLAADSLIWTHISCQTFMYHKEINFIGKPNESHNCVAYFGFFFRDFVKMLPHIVENFCISHSYLSFTFCDQVCVCLANLSFQPVPHRNGFLWKKWKPYLCGIKKIFMNL